MDGVQIRFAAMIVLCILPLDHMRVSQLGLISGGDVDELGPAVIERRSVITVAGRSKGCLAHIDAGVLSVLRRSSLMQHIHVGWEYLSSSK